MKVFSILLLVATLAVASFANVVPSNEQNLLNATATLETSNVTSTQNANSTLDMTEALLELLNAYKNVMPCGNATYGLPPLAPYRKPSIKVNFTGDHVSVKGAIDNLIITGLDDYIIIQLTTNSSNGRTEMDMIHKDIHLLGKFNLMIETNIAGFKFAQPLEGFINLQILNLRVTNGLNIGKNEAGGIKLSNLDYSLQVGDIAVNNLNTQWSVAVNNFVNQYVRDFSMLFLQTTREAFGKMYSLYVTEMANKALYNIPYSYISSSIVDAIKFFKSMECKQ